MKEKNHIMESAVDLQKALSAAQDLDARYGGKTSIKVFYDPYAATWFAKANWSGGREINAVNNDPAVAVEFLVAALEAEK